VISCHLFVQEEPKGVGGSRSKKRETEVHSSTLLFEIHLKNWISPAKRNTQGYITFRAYLGRLTIIQKVYFQTAEQYEAEYKNASRVTALKHNITTHPYSRCLWFSFIRCQFVSLEVCTLCRSAFWWLANIFLSYLRNFKKVVRLLAMMQGLKRHPHHWASQPLSVLLMSKHWQEEGTYRVFQKKWQK